MKLSHRHILLRTLIAAGLLALLIPFIFYFEHLFAQFDASAIILSKSNHNLSFYSAPFAQLFFSLPEYQGLRKFLLGFLIFSSAAMLLWFFMVTGLAGHLFKKKTLEISLWISLSQALPAGYFSNYLSVYYYSITPYRQLWIACFFAFHVWLICLIISLLQIFRRQSADKSPPPDDTSHLADLPMAPSGAPDWEQIKTDIACPICSYNLRGLTNPRCPECGYPFQWSELRPIADPWLANLVEFADKRPIHSIFRTLFKTLLPSRFFTHLKAGHAIRKQRLILHFFLIALFLLFFQFIPAFFQLIYNWIFPRNFYNPMFAAFEFQLDDVRFIYSKFYFLPSFFLVFWALFCSMAIFLLRQTVRRSKINFWHIARSVLYSASPIFLITLIYPLVFFLSNHSFMSQDAPIFYTFAFLPILLMPIWSLSRAAKHYLRIPHPLFTILTLHVAFALSLFVAICLIFGLYN